MLGYHVSISVLDLAIYNNSICNVKSPRLYLESLKIILFRANPAALQNDG